MNVVVRFFFIWDQFCWILVGFFFQFYCSILIKLFYLLLDYGFWNRFSRLGENYF
jgi:hypothetical protein